MLRTIFVILLLFASWPVVSEVTHVRFEGLELPLEPGWSDLTIVDSGFGIKTDNATRPIGHGTLSAMALMPDEYMIELENDEKISTVSLLVQFLRGKPSGTGNSPLMTAIVESFQSATRVNHGSLEIYLEDQPYLPENYKAYVIRDGRAPVEIAATMDRPALKAYLKSIKPRTSP